MNILLLISHWFHISASALLIGGMLFMVAVLRPVIGRNLSVSGTGKLADELHDRFRKYIGIVICVIIFTGIMNFIGTISSEDAVSAGYKIAIRIKVAFAFCLFIIYAVNAFLLKEKKGDEDCSCMIHPPVHKKILQVTALFLVFSILFLAVMLKSL